MAATHTRKRQHQPSIKSYFDRNGPSSSAPTASASPLSPPLPAETQASLLSVGMRVRKSVPEGYKTHKTLGTDGFPFPSTAPPTYIKTPSLSTSSSQGSARELTPFCGLHKTGGWAAQSPADFPPSSAPPALQHQRADMDAFDSGLDYLPNLSMTQSTVPSSQGSFASGLSATAGPGKKRTYEEEVEDDLDSYFDEVDAMAQGGEGRRIAPLRGGQKPYLQGVGNTAVNVSDFDEAPFLAPMDLDET